MTANAIGNKIKNRPQKVAGNSNQKKTMVEGVYNLNRGDVLLMEENGINLTQLTIGLAAAFSGEGDFLGMKISEKFKTLYLNGTMQLSDLQALSQRFSQSSGEIDFLSEEDFTENDGDYGFNLLNPVFQTQLIDYLSEQTAIKAVFFDQVPAIPIDVTKEEVILGLRRLIVEIRKLGKLQVWVFPESKSIPPFPSELATALWTVAPKGAQEGQGMEIKMTETINASVKGKAHHVKIVESENGSLRVVLRDRADVITVLNMINRGMNQTQIGDALGYDQSTVSRWFKSLGLEDDGLIRKNGTEYVLTTAGMTFLENAPQ